jgi:hypothetical protein
MVKRETSFYPLDAIVFTVMYFTGNVVHEQIGNSALAISYACVRRAFTGVALCFSVVN